ncbi:G-protein coupled receptor 183-like [Gigantopelta aegis]|uniref:G-protein coupled receptor 183-like n=1 Tax=Gigantopelta aegis TaxID=1735272 RepID=UPI001B88A912|nr:G-protein coupled receptor 183-like [Gigantopelta aegis]
MTTEGYQELEEYKVAVALWKYMSPCLLILGLVGNTLSFVVLSKSSMRETTTSLYLRFLAVYDSLVLYMGLMRWWIIYLIEYDIREYSVVVCKIHTWGAYWTTHTSAWLLVSVTVERCFSVWFPHKVKIICIKRNTYVIIATIMLVFAMLNSHYFYGLGNYVEMIDNETEVKHCEQINDAYYNFEVFIWPWIDLCIYSVIPSSILTFCNIAIIHKVVSSSRQTLQNDSSISSRRRQASSLTVMLLLVSFTYVVCTTPYCIYLIYENSFTPDEYANAREEAVAGLVWLVVTMLLYTNNSINFILYSVSGKRFRDELSVLCSRQDGRSSEIYIVRVKDTGNCIRNRTLRSACE